MSYKIIVDSCGELTEVMKESGNFEVASLSIQVDDHIIKDDETFNQAEFLRLAAASPNAPKSSCPSPETYMNNYNCEAERVYVVTLSSELSGSYNSAVLGKNLYHEELGKKNIYIFNSRTASVGETLIAAKVVELEEQGLEFEELVRRVEAYIEGETTYFVLETLETLRKNGRLTGLKAFVATALNIKPVMSANKQGVICQLGQARGINKALTKMVDIMAKELVNGAEKTLAIAHCNCLERALTVKRLIEEKVKVRDIILLDTRGISSMYASDGGIIIAV